MKNLVRFPFAGVVAAIVLSACGGGHGSMLPVAVPKPNATIAPYNGPAQLASFSWEKNLLKNTMLQGPADPSATIGMQVIVNQRNSSGLVAYAQSVSDPHSGNYRHFLTPTEIADRFGASLADYQKAAGYFAQYGIHVSGWPQREALFITGAVGQMQRAFNTTFGVYTIGKQTLIGPEQAPHLSVAIPIQQVVGMVHLQLAHTYLMRPPAGQLRGYAPQQMARAFDFTGAYGAGYTGTGINVAIVGTGPIAPQDATFLASAFQAPMAPITQVDVTDTGVTAGLGLNPSPSPLPSPVSYPYSSGFQTPPPVTSPACVQLNGTLPGCNPEDIEAQLDTQTIASMAPGSNVLFYLGYNPNDCYLTTGTPQNNSPCGAGLGAPAEGISLTDPEIQQIIADDKADVVSMSFGLGEPLGVAQFLFSSGEYNALGYGYGPIEMATMVSEGMALFASSGDNGAYECGGIGVLYITGNPPCVSYPASDPNVTSVGGVTAPLNDDGTVRTQFTAWGWQTTAGGGGAYANNIGSGGGISSIFTAPSWQAAAGVSALTGGYRGQPDISMMADPATAPAISYDAPFGGEIIPVGGTSLAAPQMAAMWALVLQACKADPVCSAKGTGPYPYRMGNPAPLLYAIYNNAKQDPSTFFDVIYGDNSVSNPPGYGLPPTQSGYQAAKGYDLVTGIGVPYAGHLINAVMTNAGSSVPWNLP